MLLKRIIFITIIILFIGAIIYILWPQPQKSLHISFISLNLENDNSNCEIIINNILELINDSDQEITLSFFSEQGFSIPKKIKKPQGIVGKILSLY
jgi:hypothetical protein